MQTQNQSSKGKNCGKYASFGTSVAGLNKTVYVKHLVWQLEHSRCSINYYASAMCCSMIPVICQKKCNFQQIETPVTITSDTPNSEFHRIVTRIK